MDDFYQGRAWIELDRAALRRNVERLSALLPPGCILMPAVKANAYGHGAVLIARELNKMGIDAFCVATVFEGVELRQNGILGEILILGYTHPQYTPANGTISRPRRGNKQTLCRATCWKRRISTSFLLVATQ